MAEENVGNTSTGFVGDSMMNGSEWVDLFVHEMMNATDLDDARGRATRILGAFERSITANSNTLKDHEHESLKQHMKSLLNDNQILERAVSTQHERHLEQQERDKEAQHLKLVLSQYQEQVRNLEMSNYALKVYLQRAQENTSISGRYQPDIY